MKGNVVILAFFVLGVIAGRLGLMPGTDYADSVNFYVLAALIFAVGVSIGNNREIVRQFRTLNPHLMLLPIATILGTLAGSAAVALLFWHHTAGEWMAVGSGLGYYSLSSVLITEYINPQIGTLALMTNIVREMTTLLFTPLLIRLFGTLSPIATGGATTMDTTLPIITKCCGEKFVPVSIFHGFVTDFSVPFLVTFFCQL